MARGVTFGHGRHKKRPCRDFLRETCDPKVPLAIRFGTLASLPIVTESPQCLRPGQPKVNAKPKQGKALFEAKMPGGVAHSLIWAASHKVVL